MTLLSDLGLDPNSILSDLGLPSFSDLMHDVEMLVLGLLGIAFGVKVLELVFENL